MQKCPKKQMMSHISQILSYEVIKHKSNRQSSITAHYSCQETTLLYCLDVNTDRNFTKLYNPTYIPWILMLMREPNTARNQILLIPASLQGRNPGCPLTGYKYT